MNDWRAGGFSLVEVVIAAGVFSTAVVAGVVLLGSTTRLATDAAEAAQADRVAENVASELEHARIADVLSLVIAPDEVASLAPEDGRLGFATHSGERAGRATEVAPADRFFEIGLVRENTLSPAADDAAAGFLALAVRVSWPARRPDRTIVPYDQRRQVAWPVAVRR